MKKMFTLMAILTFTYGISRASVHDTIVKWTFPTNTASDTVADGGIGINLNQVIHVIGAGPLIFTSTGVSTYSASASNWKLGVDTKYWQVMFNTTGYDSLFYTSAQRSSNTGPRDFKVQFRIGKLGSWTDIPVDTIRNTSSWPTTPMVDTLPTACNGKDSVFLRWDMRDTMPVSGGAIGTSGSSRIDNIKVWGHNISGVTPPVVTKAILNSLTSATVVFSEPVNSTATTVTNYTGLGTVTSAVRTVTNDTVNLTLSGLINGNAYILTVANVQDISSSTPMSPAQSFNFLLNSSIDTLVITEINYHNPPYSGNSASDSLEYIELYNNSNTMTRVGGYKLTSGLGGYGSATLYTFPAGTTVAPNTFLVFAKNLNAVNNFYHITGTIQYAYASLSNTASKLAIINTLGDYIDSLTYKSYLPWDTMAKGHGPSLVLCNPGTTIAYNSDPTNWTVSTFYVDTLAGDSVFGTPGNNCSHDAGIENYSVNSTVKCFPNPVRNILTVAPNGFVNDITMFDILGNIVFEKKNVSSSIQINTSGFNTGIYLIKVTYPNNTIGTRKISVN